MKRWNARQAFFLFVLILSVFFIAGCGGGGGGEGGGGTPGSSDTTLPTVTAVFPLNNAGDVAINMKITATFSEAMDATTITTATFTVKQGTTPVSGTVTYSGVTAVFRPASNFAAGTVYTATMTTGAKDAAGNALAANKIWTFTTGTTTDTTAPTAAFTDPADAAVGVAINRKITATFAEEMDPATITGTTFTVVNTTLGGTAVAGEVTYVSKVATFTPTSNLATSTTFTATITTGAKDLAGNALAVNKVWTFTTGTTIDTTAPTVTSTSPADLATGVVLSKRVTATFSEVLDPLTITNLTFTLKQGATAVSGIATYSGLIATFTPDSNLASNTTYTATVTTGAKDIAGNALASNKVWSFTTLASVPLGPAAVDLGTAGDFVILTKTGITTTGVTAITGDIGVSPIAAVAIAGFSLAMDATNTFSTSPLVTGKVYAADYTAPTPAKMTAAVSDMETAYTDAAGRTTPDGTELYAGNLTGQTFTPGLYKWGTDVSIDAAGTVTLNGGANDVWIFQIAGNLTVNPGAGVTLAGGALAKNIFWQVGGGTGVAFDTTSAFKGIILATKAIVFKNGATLVNGRALAQTNVTLIANTLTEPAP
jgi:hypothetical protein